MQKRCCVCEECKGLFTLQVNQICPQRYLYYVHWLYFPGSLLLGHAWWCKLVCCLYKKALSWVAVHNWLQLLDLLSQGFFMNIFSLLMVTVKLSLVNNHLMEEKGEERSNKWFNGCFCCAVLSYNPTVKQTEIESRITQFLL